jgi:drug/metabolite transporter (DMT)-like permease
MALVFLGERLHAYHVAGMLLIFAGVWLAAQGRRR